MSRYDILVVGGGPVGSRVAARLAVAGHQIAVLEKNPSVGNPVCCTGIVSQECLKRFVIPSNLVLKELNSASIFSASGSLLKLERSEKQAAVIDRGAYNAYMARQAQESGADYLLAHRVTAIQINPDGVVASVDCNGKILIFEGRALVLACGFGSKLVEEMSLGRMRDWAAGAQAEVEAGDLKEIEIYLGRDVAPGSFAWLVPAGGSRALAGLMTRRGADGYLDRFISHLRAEGKIVGDSAKPLYRGVTLRPAARTYGSRLLLVGDVAGQVKPLTGGGIYFGLLCADMAAEVLYKALETGDFSAAFLSGYQKAWRRLLGREIGLGYLARRLYQVLGDRWLDYVIRIAQRRGLARSLAAMPEIGFDWHGRAILHAMHQVIMPLYASNVSKACNLDTVEVKSNDRGQLTNNAE